MRTSISPPTRRQLPRIPARRRPSVAGSPATAAVAEDDDIRTATVAELVERIAALRAERNATVLAHNYQRPEIQHLADAVGDSLDLARLARDSRADVIVLCWVHFMAETAALLAPERTVLIPDSFAKCSLAASVTANDVRAWRDEHADGVVVSYVNTTADVKAESDYCCTSRSAVDVLRAVPEDVNVLFLPDAHLGRYVEHVTGRRLHLWL